MDFNLTGPFRQRRRLVYLIGAALFGVMLLLASCSQGESGSRTASGPSTATPEEVSLWFDRVAEAMHPCDTASRETSATIDAFASQSIGSDHDFPVVLAAGNAIEQCSSATGSGLTLSRFGEVPDSISALLEAATRWVASMEAANLAVLVAAADNIDSRVFVSAAYDKQSDANAVADEFDAVVAKMLSNSGMQPIENVQLLRWKIEAQ